MRDHAALLGAGEPGATPRRLSSSPPGTATDPALLDVAPGQSGFAGASFTWCCDVGPGTGE
ncbi:hypothetical protein [Sorangium sp. So ce131]|uniref:hypothetical protein n=1 Tax=Sorangium sp. So ce131 TaxID=3133282 RepID=UPI003F63511F